MLEWLVIAGVGGLVYWVFRPHPAAAAHATAPALPAGPQVTPGGPAPDFVDIPGILGALFPGGVSVPAVPGITPTPAVPAAATFPIPHAGEFTTATVQAQNGPVAVASFMPDTRAAMLQALSAREWRVYQALTPGLLLVGPPTQTSAANADVLSAVRLAAASGFNVYLDADAGLKLAGSAGAPDPMVSGNIVALDRGLPMPDAASNNEEVAMSPQAATEALGANFQNSRFVLFVAAGEVV